MSEVNIELPYGFDPRNYQRPVWNYMNDVRMAPHRAVCVWHRRAGKDLVAINLIGVKALERVGVYWHVLPTYKQGRKIVWDGFTRDGRKFLNHFHPKLVAGKNNTEMKVTFRNSSIYQVVGSDDIDSLVGTNPIGVVFSEYSIHDPNAWNYVRPILAENGGWALFIFTARGKNHGYKLLEMAKTNDRWFHQVLVAGNDGTKREDGTPVISDEIIEEERKSGMPEPMIQQEFYVSFEAPLVGAYYATEMMCAEKEGRVTQCPWEPNVPVNTYWDIGVGDSTTIWFIQLVGLEKRCIDYYENSGEGLPHYVKVLKEKRYVYGTHHAPWDIEVREFSSGKARIETARELGINFRTTKQHEIGDGIEAVRNILPTCWFDAVKCNRGVEALRQYRKDWNDKLRIFSDKPLHDWTSHAADAFRTFAWSHKDRTKHHKKAPQSRAVDEYDYLDEKRNERAEYVPV